MNGPGTKAAVEADVEDAPGTAAQHVRQEQPGQVRQRDHVDLNQARLGVPIGLRVSTAQPEARHC